MEIVLLTALGVGGATVLGALLGFTLKNVTHKFNDIVLSFAAGVMLAAAIIGLILPSMENASGSAVFVTVIGIFCGALCLNAIDKIVPHLHRLIGVDQEEHSDSIGRINKILLFVLAIAIHNFPEGIAAGVGFGSGIIEVIGTFIGYFAVSISASVLPFALAFAGGTMLYVISDEMIPETHAHGCERGATYALLVGFCLMLIMDFYL